MAREGKNEKRTLKGFLDSKIVQKDVGEETYLTWRETISYALGRGAQGMFTSMTGSKYLNYFLTNILLVRFKDYPGGPMGIASKIRLYCGIFDAINDPIMGVLVDKTRTKEGQMRPYIRLAPWFVAAVMLLFFLGMPGSVPNWACIAWTTFLFVGLDVTYTAFDIPMGALAFAITPNGFERTKLYGVSSIVRSVSGVLPGLFVACAAWLPYFKTHTSKAYLTGACVSAVGILLFTRITYRNTKERCVHHEDTPAVSDCFRLLFKNRPLFMLFISNLLFLLVKVTNQINFYFVADLMFDTKYNVFIDVITFPGFLIAGIGVPKLVEKLGQRFDSRTFYRVCCVAAIVLHLLFFATCYNGYIHKTPGSPVSLGVGILTVLFTGLTAIPLECKNLMQKEMEAETVDYIEWKTGTRVEGIMLSIMSFTGKIENSVSSSIGMAILAYTGYIAHEEGSVIQNSGTNMALFLMTTILPAVGYLLMLVPMAFYNISGKDHHKMVEEIKARNAAKVQTASEETAQ